jgi:hypothetical protein
MSTVIPIGLAISIIQRATTGMHTGIGQAAVEAELLDSETNERLTVAIDSKAAEKYKVIKGISKWGHVKAAFDFWAKRLRAFLDEADGKK